jgi:hypothetical protein
MLVMVTYKTEDMLKDGRESETVTYTARNEAEAFHYLRGLCVNLWIESIKTLG